MAPYTPTIENCKVGDVIFHKGEICKVVDRQNLPTCTYTKLNYLGTCG
jgi:hypothetical protein